MYDVLNRKRRTINVCTPAKPQKVRHRYSFWSRVFIHLKAVSQAKNIIVGLNEAKEIHSGRKRGKSFDEFLEEI